MTQIDLIDLDDVSDLLQCIRGSRISSLSLIMGPLQLSMLNRIEAAEAATRDTPSTSTVEIRAPAAGRFILAVAPGAELESDTIVGAVQLVHSRRPVFSGAVGYLASFEANTEAAVAYGDIVAVVRLKDVP